MIKIRKINHLFLVNSKKLYIYIFIIFIIIFRITFFSYIAFNILDKTVYAYLIVSSPNFPNGILLGSYPIYYIVYYYIFKSKIRFIKFYTDYGNLEFSFLNSVFLLSLSFPFVSSSIFSSSSYFIYIS